MKLIITAGGTSERIDDVRAITNISTGRLGKIIGETLLREWGDTIDTLYYLHGSRAETPVGKQVTPIPIGGAMDLADALERLLKAERIHGVIHAMAVSDYAVREVTTLSVLRERERCSSRGVDLEKRGQELQGPGKISSEIDDLVILLKKNPKVISLIKEWSPGTLLVGFKLLSGVSREELIETAHRLLVKNRCAFVLANDLSEIRGDAHPGYLVHEDGRYDEMKTKEEIADIICRRVMEAPGSPAIPAQRSGESGGKKE